MVQALSLTAMADDGFYAGLPSHGVFPTPSGIIFPSMFTAAGVNPAGLPMRPGEKPATGLSLDYSPTVNETQEYSIVAATAQKNYGLALGYDGSFNGAASHGVYAGAGFRAETTAIGIALRDPDLATSKGPSTDLGIIAQTGNPDITLGLVLYHLDNSPQADVGIGFGNQKNYNFELNLLMPSINSLFANNPAYTITAATTVYASIFGVSFRTSYQTNTSQVTQSAAVMIKLTKKLSVNVQYDSPNRTFYGLTILF